MQSRISYFAFSLISFLPLAALAAPVVDSGLNATARQLKLDPQIQIAGTLICEADSKTEGATCNLEIEEDETGRIYSVHDNSAAQAMRMYRAGQTNVALTGRVQDGDTLVVQKASQL